jgi:hypothetical protein
MPYPALNSLFDWAYPRGLQWNPRQLREAGAGQDQVRPGQPVPRQPEHQAGVTTAAQSDPNIHQEKHDYGAGLRVRTDEGKGLVTCHSAPGDAQRDGPRSFLASISPQWDDVARLRLWTRLNYA